MTARKRQILQNCHASRAFWYRRHHWPGNCHLGGVGLGFRNSVASSRSLAPSWVWAKVAAAGTACADPRLPCLCVQTYTQAVCLRLEPFGIHRSILLTNPCEMGQTKNTRGARQQCRGGMSGPQRPRCASPIVIGAPGAREPAAVNRGGGCSFCCAAGGGVVGSAVRGVFVLFPLVQGLFLLAVGGGGGCFCFAVAVVGGGVAFFLLVMLLSCCGFPSWPFTHLLAPRGFNCKAQEQHKAVATAGMFLVAVAGGYVTFFVVGAEGWCFF